MTLKQVETKFDNFKKFLDEKVEDPDNNEYIQTLKKVTTLAFLAGVRTKMNEIKANNDIDRVEKAYEDIITKTDIDVSYMNEQTIHKFKRYIEYFYKVSKCF